MCIAWDRARVARIVAMFAALMVCIVPVGAFAATVTLDGQQVTPVYQRDGHLLIPFRAPMERLGATVNWSNPTASASLNGQQLVTVNMGSTNALIKGTTRPLSVAPELISANAYVPVEALSGICGAQVTYSADRSSANVTGCTLAGINTIANTALPNAATPSFNVWPWLIGILVLAGALWLWMRSRNVRTATARTSYSATGTTPTAPNVIRGTVDDWINRLKSLLNQTDDAHRATFVQELSKTSDDNRLALPQSVVTSAKPAFDAAASGAPSAVSSLIDKFSAQPQLLQTAARAFANRYPGMFGTLLEGTVTRA